MASDRDEHVQRPKEEAEYPAAVTVEASRIQEITLRERRTEKNVSILVAKIDDDGDLILEGYDVGEAPREFWGDDDYEFWRVIKKEHKDAILNWLIKERFETGANLKHWLYKEGIPDQLEGSMIRKDYRDTAILWLIKERFDTDTDFKHWLDKKGIPSEFGSWV